MNIIINPIESKEDFNDTTGKLDFKVSTCFLEFENKFLVLKRGRKDKQFGLWGVPGGKLNKNESPRKALQRELTEELGLCLNTSSFVFLSKALSINPYDGRYLLYIYYLSLDSKPEISINSLEHTAFSWVTLQEFQKLNLLVSQGKAFNIIKGLLFHLLDKNKPAQFMET